LPQISITEISKKNDLGGGSPAKKMSAPKRGDATFPSSINILGKFVFISFYGKFKIFAEKATLYFFTRKLTTILKN